MDFPTMNTNISAAIISSLIYIFFAILNWCRQKIIKWCTNRKIFKTYKGYAIEFLQNCKDSEFNFYNKTYKLEQLTVVSELNAQNIQYNIFSKSNEEIIPIYAIGFLSKKYMLEYNELWLLRYILDNMSIENKWFIKDYTLVQAQTSQLYNTSFSSFSVQDENNETLFFLINDCNIVLTKNTDKNKLETILTKLKHNEFDDRIKKAIKQWKTANANINY